MKIGVISDTHGHEMAWKDAMKRFFFDADFIIHAGDLLNHGPRNPRKKDYNPAGLADAINASEIPVVISRGNCDSSVDQSCLDYPVLAPYAYLYLEGKRIFVTHGDTCMTDEEKDALANRFKADVFITGHIHVPVLEKRGSTLFLNPGSAALSKRADKVNTIAVIENWNTRIYALDTGEVLMEKSIL